MKLKFSTEEVLVVVPYDGPEVYTFIKSGWPDLYHVIYEDGAFQEADYNLRHIDHIEKNFRGLKECPEWEKFKNG